MAREGVSIVNVGLGWVVVLEFRRRQIPPLGLNKLYNRVLGSAFLSSVVPMIFLSVIG